MSLEIALLLIQDGIVNGAIYALLALALILIFTVTRVIFVPQGEFVSYGALTLASMQQGIVPGTIWLLLAAGVSAAVLELWSGLPGPHRRQAMRAAAFQIGYPVLVVLAMLAIDPASLPMWLQIVATIAIVVPMGPFLYRIVFQPLGGSSILLLLIAAVALHLLLVGVGLLAFGAEGSRTAPLVDASTHLGSIRITGQSMSVVAASVALIGLLFWAFQHTLRGKALRATAANRVGARLVGIRPEVAGRICFALAAFIGVVSGILISPMTTIYYDTGFLIALKGFVAAIIGGLASYPLAAAGALLVGQFEAFSSFWASAFKEAILFASVIPILLWLSLSSKGKVEDE